MVKLNDLFARLTGGTPLPPGVYQVHQMQVQHPPAQPVAPGVPFAAPPPVRSPLAFGGGPAPAPFPVPHGVQAMGGAANVETITANPAYDAQVVGAWKAWAKAGNGDERRTDAVRRLQGWLNGDRRQPLDLSGLNLRSVPEIWPKYVRRLDLSGNLLPVLRALPSTLEALDVSGSKLSSLESLPPSLQELNAEDNELAALPPLPDSMRTLRLSGNRLDSLTSLASLPRLETVMVARNALYALQLPDSVTEVDASNNALRYLRLPAAAEYVNVSDNFLAAVSEPTPPRLRHFDFSKNRIARMPDVSQSPMLRVLRGADNRLTAWTAALPPRVEEVDLERNAFQHNPNIRMPNQARTFQVRLAGNPFLSAPPATAPARVAPSGHRAPPVPPRPAALLAARAASAIDAARSREQQILAHWERWARQGTAGEARAVALDRLRTWIAHPRRDLMLVSFQGLGLKSLPDVWPARLGWLDVSNNRLTELLLPAPTELAHAPAADADLPRGLVRLSAQGNQIQRLHPLPDTITWLDISRNPIQDLTGVLPKGLRSLHASQTALTHLADLPKEIRTLDISGNAPSVLPVPLPQVNVLNIAGMGLATLPDLPDSLGELNANRNALTEFPSRLPDKMSYLGLSDNNLRGVPEITLAPNSPGLRVDLDGNPLSDITKQRLTSMALPPSPTDIPLQFRFENPQTGRF